MLKAEREAELQRLWRQRPEDQRTTQDVLIFYSWVRQNHPTLFYGMNGDPYQHLKSILDRHIRE